MAIRTLHIGVAAAVGALAVRLSCAQVVANGPLSRTAVRSDPVPIAAVPLRRSLSIGRPEPVDPVESRRLLVVIQDSKSALGGVSTQIHRVASDVVNGQHGIGVRSLANVRIVVVELPKEVTDEERNQIKQRITSIVEVQAVSDDDRVGYLSNRIPCGDNLTNDCLNGGECEVMKPCDVPCRGRPINDPFCIECRICVCPQGWTGDRCQFQEAPILDNVTPNDEFFDKQWSLNDIRAPEAWNLHTGAAGYRTRVAVIDSGVDRNHPDLKGNMWVNEAEYNGTEGEDDDGNGYIDDVYGWNAISENGNPEDDNGHGTHCAGIIGARTSNKIGVAGVNWGPLLIACKFLGPNGGFTSDAITCIDYSLATRAAVSNNSWGGEKQNSALEAAIMRAGTKGQVFVAAAGSNGQDTDTHPLYPGSYGLDNMLTVAAINRTSEKASWSNYSSSKVNIAAPGVSIASTYKDAGYVFLSGTSMAAPHVAGAISLMKALNREKEAKDLIRAVQTSAAPFANSSDYVTFGKLDLLKALEMVKAPTSTSTATTTSTAEDRTTPTSTLTATTTSTAEDGTAIIAASVTSSCEKACTDGGYLRCDDVLLRAINGDIDQCIAKLEQSPLPANFRKGSQASTWGHPVGCFFDGYFNVNINTNAYGVLDALSCRGMAPAPLTGNAYKVCACST